MIHRRGVRDWPDTCAPANPVRISAMHQEFVSFAAIVAYIRQLCQRKRTGTLLIMSDNRLQGQISVENGEIVFLFSHGKRGMNALQLLLNVKTGTFNFSEGAVSIKMELPATTDILEYLDTLRHHASADSGTSPSVDDPQSARPLSVPAKTILEQTLKEFIGPIASLVCADHFRSVATLSAVIEALADEIPTTAAAAQFRELAYQRLNLQSF